jgi:hypothetical protein
MQAFERIGRPWDSMIEHNVRESRTLAALRDTLLPKLLSGELRVKAAETATGPVPDLQRTLDAPLTTLGRIQAAPIGEGRHALRDGGL